MNASLLLGRRELEVLFDELAVAADERAYPHAPDDPHLVDFVAEIRRAAR